MNESLRIYNRQLETQLKDKEREFADLERKFSKLRGRFTQLDYAFRKNLDLHQEQMMEIQDLRLSQKELWKMAEDRRKQFCELKDQLRRRKDEKEATVNGIAYLKRAVSDQKKFYEGKHEEWERELTLRMEADDNMHRRRLEEFQSTAEKHIQDLTRRCEQGEKEIEVIRKRAIMLQGDVDTLRHTIKELANLIETTPGINNNLEPICNCIAKVLRSLSNSQTNCDNRMEELRKQLLHSDPTIESKGYDFDYEMLKSQNLVLREVVKKLKNELTKVQKSRYPAEKDQSEIQSKKGIGKDEANFELVRSGENEGQSTFAKANASCNDYIKERNAVHSDKEFVSYLKSQERRGFHDESEDAYSRLQEGRVKKFKDQAMQDMKSFESSFEGPISGKNSVTLKDKLEVVKNTVGHLKAEKNRHPQFIQSQLESIESHLNSVQYTEYTISFTKNHNLKIRHPIAPGYTRNIFQFRTVYSIEEYHSVPIDEAVFYFNFENGQADFPKSKMTNCAVQTTLISATNVFTQTAVSKEAFTGQAPTGVKILNIERRAIERSLRDLEKTVSLASEETLGHARSLIVNTRKFPPSEEFFDCIRYLSQCGTT